MLPSSYRTFVRRIGAIIPRDRTITDDLRTLAYGTDASFYRLIPKVILKVENEQEVLEVLKYARELELPVTFRCAGTSLSGQAISDSILVMLGKGWTKWSIDRDATTIRLQPGIVGAHANMFLAPHGRKIGPDPASINAAMIGGIAANNASGMCCGTAQNSYRTLAAMRMIFADGAILDTADPESRRQFVTSHEDMVNAIAALSASVKTNATLAGRIRDKFKMKNTTGYSLNALIDFDDPLDIIQHLMIGSEGTLGFIAEITYTTVPEHPHKASSLMVFPDIATACSAVVVLKRTPVDAVELMDRASLLSVEEKEGMPPFLRQLGPDVAALLVETRSSSAPGLKANIEAITSALGQFLTERPITFTDMIQEYSILWNIRKGLFPSVGAMRQTGTTVIIEDVAFPLPRLAEATLDLQKLFKKHRYDEAIIFGHALEGNLHFVFTQEFSSPIEISRYRAFMDDITSLVVNKYDGSLKAEHGTGRNMAPFVEFEWGKEAFKLMQDIKHILDPHNLLNPGVILNDDRQAHIKNLKPLPAAHTIIDKCIECGFCEVQCPSRDLTLTPRQRIVIVREIQRLQDDNEEPDRLAALRKGFRYAGDETCATDGLCATSCPVGIDTGKLIKDLRRLGASPTAGSLATVLAEHMDAVTMMMRTGLNVVNLLHLVLGTSALGWLSHAARALSGNALPLWNRYMPRGASPLPTFSRSAGNTPRVIYFPSCINRTMGVARTDADQRSLVTIIPLLLERAGYEVVYPPNIQNLCCGMAFASKGFKVQGDRKARELESALRAVSEDGTVPVLVDMSPCLYRMNEVFTSGLQLYEPVRFVLDHIVPKLSLRRLPETVAIHTTCSSEKMGLAGDLRKLAGLCAENVVVPHGIGCCGWAGDRGFTYPELNASALAPLQAELPASCTAGYSTSRTCEIGLSMHSGRNYQSILYLVERASR
jgi:D-lactate dehydrogenase